MPSYIPSKDAQLDDWASNFKTLIAASPTTYGLVASDATSITNAFNSWHTAFLAATNPTTRTKATIETKKLQKASMLSVVRGYAATIRVNKAITNELKIGLGLHIPDTTRTPVPPPVTQPVLKIAKIAQGYQDVQATDEATPLSRARPAGSVGLLVYRFVGAESTNAPADATFLTFVGKPSLKATFTEADRGKTVTYFARWTNARGEVGPWSQAVSAAIAA